MPILVNSSGTVAALWGSVLVRLPSGVLKRVEVGDHVHKGELIVTTADGIIEIAPDGGPATLLKVPTDETVVIGVDRDDMPEPPAAGLTGGSSGGFLEGLRVERVSELTGQAFPAEERERTAEFETRTIGSIKAFAYGGEPLPELPATLSPDPVLEKQIKVTEVDGRTVQEGRNLDFHVHLTDSSVADTVVHLVFGDGTTATLGKDVGALEVSFNGGLSFGSDGLVVQSESSCDITVPGGTLADSVVVRLPTVGDVDAESTEFIELLAATDNNLDYASGVGAIEDVVGGTLTVSISGQQQVSESDGMAFFTIRLSHASDTDVVLSYATSDGLATAVDDYVSDSNVLTFTPGEISKTIQIGIVPDDSDEGAEDFSVNIADVTGASVGVSAVTTTIVEHAVVVDGQTGVLSIDNPKATEGQDLDFHILLTQDCSADTVMVLVFNGSSDAQTDKLVTLGKDTDVVSLSTDDGHHFGVIEVEVVADSGLALVTIPAGTLADQVFLRVHSFDDGVAEGAESLTLLAGASQTSSYPSGTGTINDANSLPTDSAATLSDPGSVANVISDASADHSMTGAPGSDLFVFHLADAPATMGEALVNTINGFDMAAPASGGDALDLRDLLQGENTIGGTGNLDQYLAFDTNGPDTVIKVSPNGELVDGHPASGTPTQGIVLAGVDLRSELGMDAAASTAQIIARMLDQGKLLVDHA
jgi:hypothetical protein